VDGIAESLQEKTNMASVLAKLRQLQAQADQSDQPQQRKKNYELAQKSTREIILITDAYYRSALDSYAKTKSDFLAKRAALEQFVGNEVFIQFEKELNDREK